VTQVDIAVLLTLGPTGTASRPEFCTGRLKKDLAKLLFMAAVGVAAAPPNARVPDDGLESLIGGEPGIKY
jgi:hypothetical protein